MTIYIYIYCGKMRSRWQEWVRRDQPLRSTHWEVPSKNPHSKYDNTTTNPRRLECLRTLRILICLRKGRSPVLKTIGHILRKRRKVCHQVRGGRIHIKHPSPLHSIFYTHLVGHINGGMTPEQFHHSSQLSRKTF